jgi:hypothetical protein
LYSQQANPNFRFPSEHIPLVFWIKNVPRLEYGQRCDLQIHHCFLNDRSIACSWYIKNRKKIRVRDRFISYSKYSRQKIVSPFIKKRIWFVHYTPVVGDKAR